MDGRFVYSHKVGVITIVISDVITTVSEGIPLRYALGLSLYWLASHNWTDDFQRQEVLHELLRMLSAISTRPPSANGYFIV